jgi:hypothetical protein
MLWQIARALSVTHEDASFPARTALVKVAPREAELGTLAIPAPTAVAYPFTVAAMATIGTSPTPAPTRVPSSPVARAALPVDEGYVVSVDGTMSDLWFPWNGEPMSSRVNWSLELWLRPRSENSGTIYAEAGSSPGTSLTRVVWADGADVWVAGTGPTDSSGDYVARGAASWNANIWHHLGVSWSDGVPLVVIDGIPFPTVRATSTEATNWTDGETSTGIFVPVGPSAGYVGEFDEVRFWSTSLGAKRFRDGRHVRMSSDTPNLAHLFPVSAGRGSGAVIEDATRQGGPIKLETGARWVAIGESTAPIRLSAGDQTDHTPTSSKGGAVVSLPIQGVVGLPNFDALHTTEWVLSGDARPLGDGWLRLAEASLGQLGVARYERDLPIGAGLTVRFAYRVTRGDGPAADGVVAFLWDPQFGPFSAGYGGGSLGYARYCETGLAGAIVGVGIDVFGTFDSSEPTCNDEARQRSPNSISVRGSGQGGAGYSLVTISTLRRELVGRPGTTATVAVMIKLFTDGTLSVYTKYDSEEVMSRDIDRVSCKRTESSLPVFARFGLAGATGGLFAAHDVRDVVLSLGTE